MQLGDFPTLNATLNATSGVLLTLGWLFIRRKAIAAHRACMLSATLTSTLFLISYLYYHFHAGSTRFTGEGPIRTVYFVILISHTLMAITLPPLVVMTLRRALRGEIARHRKLARVTLPIWLFVSVTGVIVYFMLYHLPV